MPAVGHHGAHSNCWQPFSPRSRQLSRLSSLRSRCICVETNTARSTRSSSDSTPRLRAPMIRSRTAPAGVSIAALQDELRRVQTEMERHEVASHSRAAAAPMARGAVSRDQHGARRLGPPRPRPPSAPPRARLAGRHAIVVSDRPKWLVVVPTTRANSCSPTGTTAIR